MKRHFLFLLLVFGVLGLKAQTFTYGDLNYEVNYGGTSVTVLDHVDGTDATGTLTIPDHVVYNGNNYGVTIIDSYAFSYCRGLEGTLVLPNTLEEIGDDAFDYCGFTGVVNIPASVEWIGYTPFYGCDGIDGFVVDAANEDYDSRDNCNAVISSYNDELKFGCKNSTIPNGVESIAEDAFLLYDKLEAVTIGKNVKKIESGAFEYSGKIKSLTVNSKKLKAETVKDAFKDSNISTIYTHADKVNDYKKVFTKKNTGSKTDITVKEKKKTKEKSK